jgi:Ca2+/H+ antiporter, TMEM165/GDT1 family
MFEGFISAFVLNFLTEIGDKTQIAAILLGSKFKSKTQVFLGIAVGSTIWVTVEVMIGSMLSSIIPRSVLDILAGISFLLFGIYSFFDISHEEKINVKGKNAFWTSLILLLLSEPGDKSQLSNIVLSTQFSPFEVLPGALLALWMIIALSVVFGHLISERFDKKLVGRFSGTIFIIMGILFIF